MSGYFSDNINPVTVRTSEGVADIIRREILSGNLKPDQPLLERNLAQELGVSRTPVREALFALQGEGLVELVPRKYARVRKITPKDISQIYALRLVLEAHAAESAARYADSAAILEIETTLLRQKSLPKNCSAMEQANADLAFHAAISAASGSQILKTVSNQVLGITATLRSRFKYEPAQTKLAFNQHKAILAAIKERNPELAFARMSEHIQTSTDYAKGKVVIEES
ncbi:MULTISPECIES: GntR family transcriptional regulator [Actibacterium]|uniref:DNA-binding GntR family transcriptional regulator n=1 Tax=Actibacterium naphthalenivorans TaxID=1614693 RepID=A0A840CJ65_9RHOB|nr:MULTISPECIES: GntR family transcriptional regulator [Actibacterium]MBB4024182.1 DNA-binding GntR family transcriptional regulator [Actibacterium naphthalenivorans]